MNEGILKNTSPLIQLILSALVVVGSFLLFLFLAALFAFPIFKLEPEELLTIINNLSGTEHIGIMKYFQIWLSIGTFVFPAFLLAYLIGGNSIRYLMLNRHFNTLSLLHVLLVMLIALPIINLLAQWNAEMNLPDFLDGLEGRMKEMEERAGKLTEAFLESDSIIQFALNLVMIAIIPAVGEELLFRGVIQRIFCEWTRNNHLGIIIAAGIFSAFHLQFYGFLPRLALGIFFGYLFLWSRTIWLPVLAHFINNGLAVTVYFIFGEEFVTRDIDSLGTGRSGFLLVAVTVIFVALLIWNIYRTEQINQKPSDGL